jgi:hypothetical protein
MTATATEFLSRRLRARQSALRCDRQAAVAEAKAARYPDGSALRADWLSIARVYRDNATEWQDILDGLTPEDTPTEEETCWCDGDHHPDDHDAEAALDADADAYFDRD